MPGQVSPRPHRPVAPRDRARRRLRLRHRDASCPPTATTERRTFDLAFELVAAADLGRLVSGHLPLRRFRDAIEHAAQAGSRGAVKVAFDLRDEKDAR
jgi:hypothetical protein